MEKGKGTKIKPQAARKTSKTVKSKEDGRSVKFTYHGDAREVYVSGEFNAWDQKSHPMKKGKDGVWTKAVKLAPGRYEYNLIVDGQWVQDMSCTETKINPYGTKNCVVTVP